MVARLVSLIIFLFADVAAQSQVPDGQDLVRAALTDTVVYTVLPTGSMIPAIDESDWIVVKMLPWATLRQGDIVLYQSKTRSLLIVHAILRRSSNGSMLLMKGYANPGPDAELVTEDMYRGTVVGVIKRPR